VRDDRTEFSLLAVHNYYRRVISLGMRALTRVHDNYTVSQKTRHYNIVHNFAKCFKGRKGQEIQSAYRIGLNAENLVKIALLGSEISLLQTIVKKE